MTNRLEKLDKTLKSVGITGSYLTYEETLNNGFNYVIWWKYAPISRSMDDIETLRTFFGRIGVSLDELDKLSTLKEKASVIKEKLTEQREGLDVWFELGSTICLITWMFCDRFAQDTESAREIIREPDVRKACANLAESLIKIGWSPDEAEKFFLDKVVPFLYEEGLRRWVDDQHMAVMSDLRFMARQLDKVLDDDSDKRRIAGSTRALVEEIPFVGKALAILVFGVKKGKV